MMDDILTTKRKRHTQDLNIVPILDMLTTVIFFLLLSAGFMEFTKLTLPPSATVTSTSTVQTVPVAPRLVIKNADQGQYLIQLAWGGAKPGQNAVRASEGQIVAKLKQMTASFSKSYPNEKTVQVSLQRRLKYQILIAVMDGVRDSLPDVVLATYEGAE